MKKIILLISLLLISGCETKYNYLNCSIDEVEIDNGKSSVNISFKLKNNLLEESYREEIRNYSKEKDALAFYEEHKNYSEILSNKEIKYNEIVSYTEEVEAKTTKSVLETQGYKCNYSNTKSVN